MKKQRRTTTRKAAKPKQKAALKEVNYSGLTIDADDDLFRSLTQSTNDFTPIQYQRAVEISRKLYERDGLAAALINIPCNAIASGGITLTAKDPIVQEVLDDFYTKGHNPFERILLGEMNDGALNSALVNGEISLPFKVNPANGYVDFAFIEPLNVEDVKKQASNVLKFDYIELKRNPATPDAKTKYQVLNQTIDGKYEGEVIHRALFSPLNAKRGRPLLLRYIDFLDLYGQFIFNEAENAVIRKNLFYLVTLNGSDSAKQKQWLQENFPGGRAPKPLSVRVKNEQETWEVPDSNLNAADTSKFAEMLKLNAFGTNGYPVFFLGYGGDVNNTVSREMMTRASWEIARVQQFLKGLLREVCGLVIAAAVEAGRQTSKGMVKQGLDMTYDIKFGSPFPRDEVQASATLSQIVGAVTTAVSSDLMSKQTAKELILVGAKALGVEKTVAEMDEEFSGEAQEPENEDELGVYAITPEGELMTAPPGERPNMGERDMQSRNGTSFLDLFEQWKSGNGHE